jgi:hypothetical protein
MTTQEIVSDIQWLYAKLSQRDQKYLRNYNRFMSNGMRREGIRQVYTNPSSYFNAQTDEDTGLMPSINVGRSMVLTLKSKLIQTKGRIFFNPVNGLWETIKVCRNSQIYFDMMTERDNLYTKAAGVVQDGLIFEYGVLHIDDETKSTYRVKPWEFYVDPAELNYGKVSRCFVMHENYPLVSLKDKLKQEHEAYADLQRDRNCKVKVYKYWDLVEKKRYLFINSELIEERDIDYDKMPFILYYYQTPIKGLYSNSIMDNCYQNQRQIDDLLRRIHDALTLSPANTIYVPRSAQGVNENVAKMMSNRVGNVVPYDAALGNVVVATPPAIDGQYLTMLEFFQRASFEQEGISQLSAQSKKPSGINSGVALDTLQDVESERFQDQVDNLIQFYKDVYSTMIEVFPEGDEILPKRLNRANIKWSEIKRQREAFSMQSSLASVLSKDPKVKMEQIEKLQQQGIINPYMAASLLQLPDLEGAYSAATASYDCSRKIIERALDNDEYDFYPVVNLKQLLDESVNILLQLDSVDEDPKILSRLVKLIGIVNQKIGESAQAQNPPAAPVEAPPLPHPAPSDTAFQGQQIAALADIAERVHSGAIAPEVGRALINAAYPSIDPNLVIQIVGIDPEEQALQTMEQQTATQKAQLDMGNMQLQQQQAQTAAGA